MDSLIDDNTILAQDFFPGRSVGGCRAKWPMREMEMQLLHAGWQIAEGDESAVLH